MSGKISTSKSVGISDFNSPLPRSFSFLEKLEKER
jgi:hypothetical protein